MSDHSVALEFATQSLKNEVADQLTEELSIPGQFQAVDYAGLLSKFDSVFELVAPMIVGATPAQYREVVSGVVALVKSLLKIVPVS